MKEADLYVSHGLFDEAREIYQSLLRHFQSQMESTTTPDEQTNKVAQAGVKILQDRLREIDRQFDPFYGRPKPSEASQGAEADLDKETIFNAAVALKEIGLYDEAIQEFKRAAKLRYNVSECYEKISDSLIQKGDFLQAIKIFRTLLQSKDISPTQRTTILEKIASAYEATGDKNKALETYQELVNEVKTHTSAFEKVEQLTREVKRFPLSIALVTEHPRIFLIVSLLIACFF
ncbi:MAG: tetratricopeptide repeat protein, partial [Desulfobacterales bacterium]|nr:tetratricopeptide repeat protein [Desulfobacterales bacterium]